MCSLSSAGHKSSTQVPNCFVMRPNVHLSGDTQVICSTSGNAVQTGNRGNNTVPIILSRSLKGKIALTSLLIFSEEYFRFPSSGLQGESCTWETPSSREVLSIHDKIENNSPCYRPLHHELNSELSKCVVRNCALRGLAFTYTLYGISQLVCPALGARNLTVGLNLTLFPT